MHKIPSKFYVLPLLLIAICTITMVCASFSEEMMITGDAYVRVDKDIRITDIKMVLIVFLDILSVTLSKIL